MTTKVWNLMYVLGNTGRITGEATNPQSRKTALDGAAVVDRNGWRVWVEHHKTGKRLYENAREKAFQADQPDTAPAPSTRTSADVGPS
jgi:hypothetical protein